MVRTFYIKDEDFEIMESFQKKCLENGQKSYSQVIVKFMKDYANGNN